MSFGALLPLETVEMEAPSDLWLGFGSGVRTVHLKLAAWAPVLKLPCLTALKIETQFRDSSVVQDLRVRKSTAVLLATSSSSLEAWSPSLRSTGPKQ